MSKEILKDEILTDEQLEGIAGGTFAESYSDANEFEKLGVKIFETKIAGISILDHAGFVNLRASFDKYGVKIVDDGSLGGDLLGTSKKNQYFIDGKEVTQAEAWKHIKSQFGK